MQVLNNPDYRLGLEDVEPDILGRAYEYLLRKFAEGQGQSAGEFYTPREVAVVMARILDPQPGATVYDPCPAAAPAACSSSVTCACWKPRAKRSTAACACRTGWRRSSCSGRKSTRPRSPWRG